MVYTCRTLRVCCRSTQGVSPAAGVGRSGSQVSEQ